MIALVAALALSQQQDPTFKQLDYHGPVTLPFTSIIGQVPAFDVSLADGSVHKFDLDTCAQGTGVINEELAEDEHLAVVGHVTMGDPSGKNSNTVNIYLLPTLKIGSMVFHDVELPGRGKHVTDPRHQGIDGVIGIGLYKQMLLILDYGKHEVTFTKDPMPAPTLEKAVPVTWEDPVPSILVTLPTGDVRAHIDSGSMGGLLVPEKVAKDLPFDGEPKVVGHARTMFNTFDIHAGKLKGKAGFGGTEMDGPMIEFTDLLPDANIGSRMLSKFTLYFDQRVSKMAFVPVE